MLDFFNANSTGIFVLIGIVFSIAFLVQWLAWIFCWGRFKLQPCLPSEPASGDTDEDSYSWINPQESIRRTLLNLLTKIIVEFRHLLALSIVFVFILALSFVGFRNGISNEELLNGIQVVASSIGPLIGSIIGYYFGESAAEKKFLSGQIEPGVQGKDTENNQSVKDDDSIKPSIAPPGIDIKENT